MTWNIVPHRNCSLQWWAGSSAVREKVARLLKFDLGLPLHIAKELDRRSCTTLSARSEERDSQSAEQDKPYQEILNHARKAASRPSPRFLPRTRGSQSPRSVGPKPR